MQTVASRECGSSYVVNADNSVSFCYCGAGKRVEVVGDFQYTGKDSSRYSDMRLRKVPMVRGSDGCFHARTLCLVPETYTYCFRVDGKYVTDEQNNDSAWQTTRKWSILSLSGTRQTELYLPPEVQGEVIHSQWYDREACVNRQVYIYLPAAYRRGGEGERFPVLYLLHGINGYEGSWTERGRAIQIIENLIAEGSVSPMIVVMPDCNTRVEEGRASHRSLWNNVWHYPGHCRDHSLELAMEDLMAHVDSSYRVSGRCVIAGFSSGARNAANIVNRYPGRFEAVGIFSPVVSKKQQPQTDIPYYIYTGQEDMFVRNGRRFHRRLAANGVEHEYVETGGGHTWRSWREQLVLFLTSTVNG